MRILIGYATKSGSCKALAEQLASLLPNHTVTVADLAKTAPVPGDFDYIVLGGPIRMGKAHKALRRYIAAHAHAVAALPHALFLCCAFPDQFENYLEMTYPAGLLRSAEQAVYFGGELNPAKQKGMDKLLTRMMRNSIRDSEDEELALPGLLPEHVRLLADHLRKK